jgi:gamma-glutamyltranspeptidase/glutathione hydrolase
MKKNHKRIISSVMAASLAVSMAACSGSGTTSTTAPETTGAAESSAEETKPALTPAYPVDDFQTVDSEGNRITDNREATSKKAMAVASKYEVSQVGAEILKKGGNAVDAAVAMGFALGVCEPFTSGLGGGGIATIHTADGKNYFVDFREVAPAAATLDKYVDANGEPNDNAKEGGLASGVPGECAGLLYMLENYGTMTRAEVMEPAIRIAREGFTVSTYCANAINDAYETAQKYPEMQKVYWDENELPYGAGSVINNPDLADTLQKISDQGADVFYKGEIGQALVDSLAEYDGVMTMDDMANYQVLEHDPVEGDYRGYKLISSPPPSSGGTHLIEILNILENYDIGSMQVNSPEYVHYFAEAFKLAFADRAKYMADTAFTDVPLTGLTSQEYANQRAALINPDQAMEEAAPDDPTVYEHTDTTHFSVGDIDGNCVAVTKTINYYFGSGVMVKGCGFMMNNQMGDFSTDKDSVNVIEPGKKPLSSMSPTIVLNADGSPFMITGTPGGSRIFSSVAQTISRVIDSKMSLHDAICVPKIWNCSNKNKLEYEKPLKGFEQYALTDDTIAKLQEMGHGEIKSAASGSVNSIIYNGDGTITGVGDPRQDGKAVGVD